MTDDSEVPRRLRWAVIAALTSLAFLHGTAWAILTEVPSPIDEIQHLDYVETLLDNQRPPVVGARFVDQRFGALAKNSPTFLLYARAVSADPTDPGWGPVGQSYEGIQPPLSYLAYTPAWAVVRAAPVEAGLLLTRLWGVLLASVTVPLLAIAGRDLFEDVRIGERGAAVYAALLGPAATAGAITNDVLVPVVGAGLLIAGALIVRRRDADVVPGALGGAAAASALLVKSTTLGAVIFFAGVAAAVWWYQGGWRRMLRLGAIAAGAGGLVLAPWIVFSVRNYGGLSAAERVDRITGGNQVNLPPSVEALLTHLRSASTGFLSHLRVLTEWDPYEVVVAAVLAAIAIIAWRRGDRGITALAVAWPVTLLGMLAIIFVVFDGRSSVVGRHLLVAAPAVALALGAGSRRLLDPRFGHVVLAALFALVLVPREVILTEQYVDAVYGQGVVAGTVPVRDPIVFMTTDLARADGRFDVRADCPIQFVDITGRPGEEAPELRVGTSRGMPVGLRAGQAPVTRVEVADPDRILTVVVSGQTALDATATPVIRPYCPVDDPAATRFAAVYDPGHPVPLRLATVRAWQALLLLSGAGWLAVAGAAWWRR